jgi:transcriptional regulator with XRE-family HTH domain
LAVNAVNIFDMATLTVNLTEAVAREVRAEMARRRASVSDVADRLGLKYRNALAKCNGKRPFSLDEVHALAAWFGVPLTSLLDPAASSFLTEVAA